MTNIQVVALKIKTEHMKFKRLKERTMKEQKLRSPKFVFYRQM